MKTTLQRSRAGGRLAAVICLLMLAPWPTPRGAFEPRWTTRAWVGAQVSQPGNALRTRYTINDGWKFWRADSPEAGLPPPDDASWKLVNLPHTWNVEDTRDDVPGYYRGVGWYRRNLRLGPHITGKRLFLHFEGANQVADAYLNGRHVGRHIGGYTGFTFDITDAALPGGENLLAIRVDNSHDDRIPPLNADFNFYGGIYRDVWLVAASPVHLTLLDHGSSGVHVDTPSVNERRATVRVRGAVSNSTASPRQVEVLSTVLDADGREVSRLRSTLRIAPESVGSFEQVSAPVERPRLWSPDDPNLYAVTTVVWDGGRPVDEVNSPLGFRWFAFDAERGFFLNGEHMKLRGTNRHQDREGMGNALPDALHVRDMELIKEAGFNFVRLAHYPQDPSVLEAADRLGLILWEEIPVVNQIKPSKEFTENAERMLVEMIRQHRNHPSVVLWGYMNEVFLGPKPSEALVGATVRLARALEEVCRREDPARPTAIAFDHGAREIYNSSGIGEVTQVVGWNLYHGWYYEEFSDLGRFLDEEHRRFPQRPLIVSEYGAGSDARLHSLTPRRFDFTAEWQRRLHEAFLPQIEERPFVAGGAVWNHFDFGSEFRGDSIPHINQKGLLTYDRRPKDILYFYKAKFSSKPVLHIATREWSRRAGTRVHATPGGSDAPSQVPQPVEVYTNLSDVELLHNGTSLGRRMVGASRHALWEVNLVDGANVFIAQGRYGNEVLYDRTEIYFTSRAVRLTDPSVPFKELAVNVGAGAQFVDEGGTAWVEDQAYMRDGWGYVAASVGEVRTAGTSRNIRNTTEDPLYQTMLQGLSLYRFEVPDGEYEIELRFAEHEFKEPGRRVFDITVNGELLERLDLAKEAGQFQAVAKKFRARASEGEGVRIGFMPVAGRPLLSAVRIRRLGP